MFVNAAFLLIPLTLMGVASAHVAGTPDQKNHSWPYEMAKWNPNKEPFDFANYLAQKGPAHTNGTTHHAPTNTTEHRVPTNTNEHHAHNGVAEHEANKELHAKKWWEVGQAAPAGTTPSAKKGPRVWYCANKLWGWPCWGQPAVGQCVNKGKNKFSLGPDKGLNCALYNVPNCYNAGHVVLGIVYPGNNNIPGKYVSWLCDIKKDWGKKAKREWPTNFVDLTDYSLLDAPETNTTEPY